MKKFLIILSLLCSFNSLADNKIKVAVIDTGLDPKYRNVTPLCQSGHKDFTGEGFKDIVGHGTNVTGLIVNNAKSNNYCIVIIKAYAFQNKPKSYVTEALQYAYDIKVNVINLSGGGPKPIEAERQIVEKILDSKITLIVAAGNNELNLDKDCKYFPACYDTRLYVIGNSKGMSNYGKIVDMYINGRNRPAFGQIMSGTSQSTAIFTGQLLEYINKKQQGFIK